MYEMVNLAGTGATAIQSVLIAGQIEASMKSEKSQMHVESLYGNQGKLIKCNI
jgi:hypothetical protein